MPIIFRYAYDLHTSPGCFDGDGREASEMGLEVPQERSHELNVFFFLLTEHTKLRLGSDG